MMGISVVRMSVMELFVMVKLMDAAMVMVSMMCVRMMDLMMWRIVVWCESVEAMRVFSVLTVWNICMSVKCVVDWVTILVIFDHVQFRFMVDVGIWGTVFLMGMEIFRP